MKLSLFVGIALFGCASTGGPDSDGLNALLPRWVEVKTARTPVPAYVVPVLFPENPRPRISPSPVSVPGHRPEVAHLFPSFEILVPVVIDLPALPLPVFVTAEEGLPLFSPIAAPPRSSVTAILLPSFRRGQPSGTGFAPAVTDAKPSTAKESGTNWTSAATAKPSQTAVQPTVGSQTVARQAPQPIPQTAVSGTEAPLSPPTQEKALTSRVGEEVFIQFDRLNWIYVDRGGDPKRVGFREPRYEKNSTAFVFKPREAGDFVLEFQRQDNQSGTTETQLVRWKVLPPSETSSASTTSTSSANPTETFRQAEALERAGKSAEALKLYLQGYRPEDGALNLRIADLLEAQGQSAEALKYLERNQNPADPSYKASLDKSLELAMKNANVDKLVLLTTQAEKSGFLPGEELFLEILDFLQSRDRASQALEWARKYDAWFPAPRHRDGYYFLLAQLLERPGPERNIVRSIELYRTVLDDYPLSPYWTKAGERANYLNRNYFQVR